jgi:hypothetical protein
VSASLRKLIIRRTVHDAVDSISTDSMRADASCKLTEWVPGSGG